MSIDVLKVCKPGYIGPANLMVVTLEDHEAEIAKLKTENESLRKALIMIRDESNDLRICEISADALVDAISFPENP